MLHMHKELLPHETVYNPLINLLGLFAINYANKFTQIYTSSGEKDTYIQWWQILPIFQGYIRLIQMYHGILRMNTPFPSH